MRDGLGDLFGGAVGLASGGYLLAVVLNGNTKQLGNMLVKEKPFLEFLVALIVLNWLRQYGPTSKIADTLIGIALVGALLRVSTSAKVRAALGDFGAGKTSLFDTVAAMTGLK